MSPIWYDYLTIAAFIACIVPTATFIIVFTVTARKAWKRKETLFLLMSACTILLLATRSLLMRVGASSAEVAVRHQTEIDSSDYVVLFIAFLAVTSTWVQLYSLFNPTKTNGKHKAS